MGPAAAARRAADLPQRATDRAGGDRAPRGHGMTGRGRLRGGVATGLAVLALTAMAVAAEAAPAPATPAVPAVPAALQAPGRAVGAAPSRARAVVPVAVDLAAVTPTALGPRAT